jgi:hypothetical protein
MPGYKVMNFPPKLCRVVKKLLHTGRGWSHARVLDRAKNAAALSVLPESAIAIPA